MKLISFMTICLVSIATMATTPTKPEIVEAMAKFHENPAKAMNELPEKKPIVGEESMLDYMTSPFGQKPLDLGDLVEIKSEGRSVICRVKEGVHICGDEVPARSGVENNDLFQNLVDANSNQVKTLEEIEEKNLLDKSLSTQPWSDDYWAIANGVLAHRYAHHSGETDHQWQIAYSNFQTTTTQDIIDQGLIHQLSPSEKYDLLVGDKSFTLTNTMFLEGKGYYDRDGKVESWMGICHGWAGAAFMLPRPKQVVWAKSFDGKYDIPFYPADIKALGSLLYAKNKYTSNFIGGRCNVKDPKQDENGRVIEQQCFDNNPASWHFAVVNQIGVNNRSMVMDATFDYEVWNQPILGYSIRYFNPKKYQYTNKLKDATDKITWYTNDKFKQYRDKKSKYIVGIEMKVKYIVETRPRQLQRDSEYYDAIREVTYRYDLELDSEKNVIGGEWYTNAHPDFLWTPTLNSKVITQTDKYLASNGLLDWDADQIVAPMVNQYAQHESRRGSPLAIIVEGLFKAANK